MRHSNIKQFVLLLSLFLTVALSFGNNLINGYSLIQIQEAQVQGTPRGSSIQASIDGHWLSVVFLENLGQVYIEILDDGGGEAQSQSTPTPNGVNFYLPANGRYIIIFTLPNGDTYYGEFEVSE